MREIKDQSFKKIKDQSPYSRGKGSIKEGKLTRKDGTPFPGENEELHAYVTGPDRESIKKACDRVR